MGRMVSIRRSLLTNLVLVVLLLGVTILAMSFFSHRRTMQRFSQSLIDQTLSRTEVELQGFIDPVRRQLGVLQDWAEGGELDRADSAALDQLLGGIMRQHPWITSCMVADRTGQEHMLLHESDRWRSRQTLDPDGSGEVRWRAWTDDKPTPVESSENLDYDPRTRPWFLGAVEKLEASGGGPSTFHWTEPYSFFTTEAPGITASVAFLTPDGALMVIGLDIALIDISRFTTTIEVHRRGVSFVLDEDGRFIGLPHGPNFLDEAGMRRALLRRPEELDTPMANAAAKALLGREQVAGNATRFASQGEALWGQVRSFELASDRHLLIGVVVPEAELLAFVQQQRIWVGILTVAVLVLAIGRAIILAGRYSRPVEALVRDSERISSGDLEAGEPIATRVAEVQRLAGAHDKMREGLKTLLRIEHDLKIARRIQESTYPERLPNLEGFDIAAWSEPADETGGDTFDVIGVHGASIGDKILLTDEDAGRAMLLLADATGHGIGPALSVTQVRAMLRIAVRMTLDLSEIATHMNEQLCADLPRGRFVTCWLGLLDSANHTLTSVSGGQGPLLRYHAAQDQFDVLPATTTPFGLFNHDKIELPPPIRMEPGDIYAAISDGIFEARSPGDEEFGTKRTMEVIRRHRAASTSEILDEIRQAVLRFSEDAPADDDRTIILIKRVHSGE